MKRFLFTCVFIICAQVHNQAYSQNIGINAAGSLPNNSAGLDVDFNNKGLLIPRIALTSALDATTIATPAISLLIYNTATAGVSPNNVIPGYYYWNGTKWEKLATDATIGTNWTTTGNSGTIAGINFIGTIDDVDLILKRNNLIAGKISIDNTSLGLNSLNPITTGSNNIAFGKMTLSNNTSGSLNTAIGVGGLYSNTIGNANTSLGVEALYSNKTGVGNSAFGYGSLFSNTSGTENTAFGNLTLHFNKTGILNTAIGFEALAFDTSGSNNIAIGHLAGVTGVAPVYLNANRSGNYNIFIGDNTGPSTPTQINNSIAIGKNATVATSNSMVLGGLGIDAVNVGIGTTSPIFKLDVNGNGRFTSTLRVGSYTLPSSDGMSNQVLKTNGSGTLSWSNDNSNSGTVTSVALSMPSIFTVSGSPITTSGTITSTLANQSANTIFAGPASGLASTPTFRALVANDIPLLSGYIQNTAVGNNFTTGQAASIDITGNAEISGTLEVNGNVGIGTTSATRKLTISGSEATAHGFNACMSLSNTAAGGSDWFLRSGATGTATPVGGFSIADNAGYRFVIDNTGNVGIGSTAPSQKLHVVGNGLFTGTVTASCGTLVCSDKRYKKDITPLKNSLTKIKSLNGYTYKFKTTEFPELNFNSEEQIGFIAQELETLFPQMVHTDENGYKTVDYSKMTPVLVEAIKEQQKQLDDQKTELNQLKQQLELLLKKIEGSVLFSEK